MQAVTGALRSVFADESFLTNHRIVFHIIFYEFLDCVSPLYIIRRYILGSSIMLNPSFFVICIIIYLTLYNKNS